MNLSENKIITIVLIGIVLVSGVGFGLMQFQDSSVSEEDEDNPTESTPTPTPEPEDHPNFESFEQVETDEGYTVDVTLSEDSKYSYEDLRVVVNNTQFIQVEYENGTVEREWVGVFETEDRKKGGISISESISLVSLAEEKTVEIYAKSDNKTYKDTESPAYVKVAEHTITGNDMNYNVTITASNMSNTIDGVIVNSENSNRTTLTTNNESVTVTNITKSESLNYNVWVDKNGDGNYSVGPEYSREVLSVSNEHIGSAIKFHESQNTQTYKYENVTITFNSTEYKNG